MTPSSDYFHWTVDPVLLHIWGPFGIRWYSLLFLSGFFLASKWFMAMVQAEGKRESIQDSIVVHGVVGTIVGARLGHCLLYDPAFYLSNPLRILKVWEGGLASHGGYLGVLIAIAIFARKNRDFSFFWLMDRICFVSIFAGGFIRIGNFFNHGIVGQVTNVPWAVRFSLVDNLPRHPSQLYEAAGYFAISFLLYLYYRFQNRQPLEGRLLGFAMLIAFAFRMLVETVKENQMGYEDHMTLNMGQLLSIPYMAMGIILITGILHTFPLTKSLFSSAKAE